MTEWDKYIKAVLSGKVLACRKTRLACERHVRDIEKAKNDPRYPYVFKPQEVRRVQKFFELVKTSEGQFAGKTVQLQPWQQFVLAMLYGWRRKKDGLRRFRDAFIICGKKSGKSFFMAALALFMEYEEPSSQVFSISNAKEQAALSYQYASDIVKASPELLVNYTPYKQSINFEFNGNHGVYKALAADASTADGKNPSFIICDEYAFAPSAKLFQALKSGTIARQQPLYAIITTAGGSKSGPCYELYQYLDKLLSGVIENDTFFGCVWELDEGDDWRDLDVYPKAMPSLGYIVSVDTMRDRLKSALSIYDEEVELRTKILGEWIDAGGKAWIGTEIWSRNQEAFDREELLGRTCAIGVDLSKNRDLTAISLYFAPDDDFPKYRAIHQAFIPENALRKKQQEEHVQFVRWVKQGFVTATPGDYVDYDYVVDRIIEAGKLYEVRAVLFDPALAQFVDRRLEAEGFLNVQVRQGIAHFSPLAKAWERDVMRGAIADPDPVMAWCTSNAEVMPDVNGNIKPLGDHKARKIDLVVSSIMAHYGLGLELEDNTSPYEERGILSI
ncbi:MAG: terminase large subunit [Clostridia bacterium]